MEKQIKTNNDIDVYSYAQPHLHSFCISLYLKAGVMYEGEDENGITHFLEHIHFRNLGGLTQGELYRRLEMMGANFNAATYREFLRFYITAASAHFDECAELFAMLLAPITATKADVNAERKRIQSEIREDAKGTSLEHFANRETWGGTSLSRLITGTIGGVNGIDLEMLKAKKAQLFTCDNLFFYVTGCYTEDNLHHLFGEIEKYRVSATPLGRDNTAPVPERFGNRDGLVALRKNEYMPSVQFTFDMGHGKYTMAETDLLYNILFYGELSRFKMLLSEENGLLYDFDAYLERYRNIGTLYLQFSVVQGRMYDAIRLTTGMFLSMKRRITQEDLAAALTEYLDNGCLLLDQPDDLNWEMAYENHIMQVGYKDIEKVSSLYKAVTPERLMQIAEEVFKTNNLTVTLKADKKKTKPLKVRALIAELDG